MAASKDEIENLAVHVDQLLLSHVSPAGGWVPIERAALEGLQMVLEGIRPGRPADAESPTGSGAASPAPADPPLPSAAGKAVSS